MPWKIEHLLYKMSKGKHSCRLEDIRLRRALFMCKLLPSYLVLRSFHILRAGIDLSFHKPPARSDVEIYYQSFVIPLQHNDHESYSYLSAHVP